jgi:hypothetical protein
MQRFETSGARQRIARRRRYVSAARTASAPDPAGDAKKANRQGLETQ